MQIIIVLSSSAAQEQQATCAAVTSIMTDYTTSLVSITRMLPKMKGRKIN